MTGSIRWSRKDYATLGKAVSSFNRKINELEQEGKKLYLPVLLDYKEVKENILTRKELNRTINALKRFQKEGAEDIYRTEGGELLTKWEYKELKNLQRSARNKLNREITGMRLEGQPFPTTEETNLRFTLRNIEKLDTAEKSEFQRIKSRIEFVGSSDYEYKKALIWKENYMKTIERYSNYRGYDKLMKVLKRYQNPIAFFNLFKDNTETLIVDYLHYISDKMILQAQFNQLLREFGIDIEDSLEDIQELVEN